MSKLTGGEFEINSLRSDLDAANCVISQLQDTLIARDREIAELKAVVKLAASGPYGVSGNQLEKYRKALEFYSKKEHYFTTSEGFAAQYDPVDSEMIKDQGKRAREALK